MSKAITGFIEQISGKRIKVRARSAAVYDVDLSQAKIFRKNGQELDLQMIELRDKVSLVGQIFSDNSILATEIRDLSVYPRKATLSGRVEKTEADKFTIFTRLYGEIQVVVSNLTQISLPVSTGLKAGQRVKVRGVWERPRAVLHALSVESRARKVKIEFQGELVMRAPGNITVVADGVIYGVDIGSAVLKNKNKTIGYLDLPMGGKVKVFGKHLPEDVAVIAETVRVVG